MISCSRSTDAEYDVERSVSDFMHYARQYADGSAAARGTLEARLGVRYGPTVDEYLDIFPASRPGAPILVFLHGGYWRILSARDFSFVASGPVAAGVTVAVVNYALCPAVTLDEIVRQTRAVIVWLWRHAREHSGDPENIHVCGHSAGGQELAGDSTGGARVDVGLKHFAWLVGAMGERWSHGATVHAYGPIYGSGATVVEFGLDTAGSRSPGALGR